MEEAKEEVEEKENDMLGITRGKIFISCHDRLLENPLQGYSRILLLLHLSLAAMSPVFFLVTHK